MKCLKAFETNKQRVYLHVDVVDSVADVLEDRLERHEQVAVLEAVLNPR